MFTSVKCPVKKTGADSDQLPKEEYEMSDEFHLHVNVESDKLTKALEMLRDLREYPAARYQLMAGTAGGPLWILSKKFASKEEAESEFDVIVPVLRMEGAMNGYVECEKVSDRNVVRFEERPYEPEYERALLESHTFVSAGRRADIHVFRSIGTPRDLLDEQLAEAGFYEVISDEERIWTLLFQGTDLAERVFGWLQSWFARAGGISKIELEIVQRLETVPHGFPLRKVVQDGNFLY